MNWRIGVLPYEHDYDVTLHFQPEARGTYKTLEFPHFRIWKHGTHVFFSFYDTKTKTIILEHLILKRIFVSCRVTWSVNFVHETHWSVIFLLRCDNRRFDVIFSWLRGWTTDYFTDGGRKFWFLCLVKAQGSLVRVEKAMLFTMALDYNSSVSSFPSI